MSEEEFLNRTLNKIDKEFGYDVASTLELMFIKKEKEIDRLNNIILNQQKRIDKTIQAIDEILIYNDLSDTTSAFGNAPRELKFYLSECDTLEEFDKLKELKEE